MFIIGAVKLIGQLAVSMGVGQVTKMFIKSITPSNATKFAKISVSIGSWFIGGALAMEAGRKWNHDVNRAVEFAKKMQLKIKQKTEESKTEKEAE